MRSIAIVLPLDQVLMVRTEVIGDPIVIRVDLPPLNVFKLLELTVV